MKTRLSIFFLLFSWRLFSQNAEAILGNWQAGDDSSKQIAFFKSADGFLYGKTLGQNADGKVPEGYLMFRKIRFDEKQKIWRGTMHPPGSDFSAEATITLENGDKMTATVRKFLMSKSLQFLRNN